MRIILAIALAAAGGDRLFDELAAFKADLEDLEPERDEEDDSIEDEEGRTLGRRSCPCDRTPRSRSSIAERPFMASRGPRPGGRRARRRGRPLVATKGEGRLSTGLSSTLP